RRHPLLEEHLAADAVREPLERGGPVPKRAEDPVPHREVVLDDVTLGETTLGEAHLVRAADPHRTTGNLELEHVRHEPDPTRFATTRGYPRGRHNPARRRVRSGHGARDPAA